MELIFFPIEILINIINNIDNKADYCNLRISCKSMYYIMNNIKHYYLDGTIKKNISFYNNALTGLYREYFRNGFEKINIQFNFGKMNGFAEVFNIESSKLYFAEYKDNKIIGDEIIYYDNGVLANITHYNVFGIHGKVKSYHANSNLKMNVSYKNNILNGACYYYYSNNVTKYLLNFKNGKLHDSCLGFYKNGQLKFVLNYDNGLLNCTCKYYYANGNISCNYYYINGNMMGNQMQFHENGKLKMIFKVFNGMLNGKLKTWYLNGEQNVICEFKNDKLVNNATINRYGCRYVFNLDNNKIWSGFFSGLVTTYKNGKPVYFAEIEYNELRGILKNYGNGLNDKSKYILDTSNEFTIYHGNRLINIEKKYINIYQSCNNIKAISYKIDNNSYFKVI